MDRADFDRLFGLVLLSEQLYGGDSFLVGIVDSSGVGHTLRAVPNGTGMECCAKTDIDFIRKGYYFGNMVGNIWLIRKF